MQFYTASDKQGLEVDGYVPQDETHNMHQHTCITEATRKESVQELQFLFLIKMPLQPKYQKVILQSPCPLTARPNSAFPTPIRLQRS